MESPLAWAVTDMVPVVVEGTVTSYQSVPPGFRPTPVIVASLLLMSGVMLSGVRKVLLAVDQSGAP